MNTRAERTLEDVRIIGALMQGNHLNETELSRGRELVYALNKALEGRKN